MRLSLPDILIVSLCWQVALGLEYWLTLWICGLAAAAGLLVVAVTALMKK